MVSLFVSFLLFYDFGKSHSLLIEEILNYGHLLLFGFIAIGILWTIEINDRSLHESGSYVKAGIISILLGIFTEFVQVFFPERYFELSDIFNDAMGTISFLAFTFSFKKTISKNLKVFLRIGTVFLIIIASFPVFNAVLDTLDMQRDFPVISSFESPREIKRWKNQECVFQRTREHVTHGKYSFRIDLHPGEFPGMTLNYLKHDWRGYGVLSFDVFLEGPKPLRITVKVNDRKHNEEYADRFNQGFILKPELNHITISMQDIMKAPKNRLMDVSDITKVSIFTHNLKHPRVLYVDNFRLEKDG